MRNVFICDTYVNFDPSAEVIAESAILAAEELRRFGLTPRVALLSHSSFGAAETPVGPTINNPHSAFAYLLQQLVRPDDGARPFGQRMVYVSAGRQIKDEWLLPIMLGKKLLNSFTKA